MSYLRFQERDGQVNGFGCGPNCNCGPCKNKFAGLGETYVASDDDDEQEPEQAPPDEDSPSNGERGSDRNPAPQAKAPAAPGTGSNSKPGAAPGTPTDASAPSPRQRSGRSRARRLHGFGHFRGTGYFGRPVSFGHYGNSHPEISFGRYGWSVKTPLPNSVEGHEVLTRNAIGAGREINFEVAGRPMKSTLTPAEVDAIIAGNRSVDLGWIGESALFILNKNEQKRHALRRDYGQTTPAALADIVGSLRAQHAGILAEPNSTKRAKLIGMATHLVQDSFSPAHTERHKSANWCIAYIRNYGRGTSPQEHGKPQDSRDEIAQSGDEAMRATVATQKYLQIVAKAIYGKTRPDPAAVSEAAKDFDRFVRDILMLC